MKYKLIEWANLLNRDDKKWYATPVNDGTISKTPSTTMKNQLGNINSSWQKGQPPLREAAIASGIVAKAEVVAVAVV